MAAPKKLVLLGATGSIGRNTLRVLREHPDKLELVGVAARSSAKELADICHEFAVPHAVLSDEAVCAATRGGFPPGTTVTGGLSALDDLATLEEADIVLVAVVGACGLRPTLAAIEAGKDIALANKELLVLGGGHVMEAARRRGVRLLPTDSEHNAIFQCLEGQAPEAVEKLILTASGGQFRDSPIAHLAKVTPDDATKHPNWAMGPKITVDSATMANKGLELIEAHWLFGFAPDRLEVVLHPQSIVHSFVQMVDGAILAQLTPPSMTFAIQHCLLYPERGPAVEATLDFRQAMRLDFNPPDAARYPCLKLAYRALRTGGLAPAVFNAANEVAVERFLNKAIPFLDIPRVIEHCLDQFPVTPSPALDTLLAADSETRVLAQSC
ncbi:MAG: 1-deoxy-D-xylulose-5-phosphate reductoisomerase [Opitutales bacterium]